VKTAEPAGMRFHFFEALLSDGLMTQPERAKAV